MDVDGASQVTWPPVWGPGLPPPCLSLSVSHPQTGLLASLYFTRHFCVLPTLFRMC